MEAELISLTKKLRILIIDDSALFRQKIQLALKDCEYVEIVGTASNGKIAVDKMSSGEIDLCTLDMEMPELDGLETLKSMREKGIKTKAIMFSSLCKAGAEKTLEAMRNGAYDFVAKPTLDSSNLLPEEKIKEALLPKILSFVATKDIPRKTGVNYDVTNKAKSFLWESFKPQVLVIASSTGGPNALVEFFQNFTEPVPFPILVAQHMPPIFTASLAERIGMVCGKVAREAVEGEVLCADQIYVAPGNFHMKLKGDRLRTTIALDQDAHRNFIRPAADFLFETAADIFGKNTLGIVFTGMGRDGADGAKAIKKTNGAVLIQSEESCVVFGMPGAVFDAGDFDYMGSPVELAMKTKIISKPKKVSYVS
jgi:two-component system, chemotaxis family, protein-glutamate methylesterase/glutaminase